MCRPVAVCPCLERGHAWWPWSEATAKLGWLQATAHVSFSWPAPAEPTDFSDNVARSVRSKAKAALVVDAFALAEELMQEAMGFPGGAWVWWAILYAATVISCSAVALLNPDSHCYGMCTPDHA